jgi:glycerate dehydrogenase
MLIVVTDGYALNSGDLSWEQIEAFGELAVHDRTPENLIVERCRDADIVLTNKVPLSKETLGQLQKLRLISVLATGYNVIDVRAAKEKNITVCNVPGYGTASVAQHTFALILELTNHVGLLAESVSEWPDNADWCYARLPIQELAAKTLGIVGLGNIGMRVANIANAFGMKVLYYSRNKKNTTMAEYRDLDNLFRESDIISLHCPLSPANTGFVNKAMLNTMKKTALLINTARGPLINEQDLAYALNDNVIAGAGLDVLSQEPPPHDHPLIGIKNCIITPHNAWMSREARQRIMDITAGNIRAFLEGNPDNVVN